MQLAGTRLRHHESRAGLTREVNGNHVWTGDVRLNEQWLTQPLKWTRPRQIFVCAHGDLFHEHVPDEWIDRVFAVMALCPQHTFQVLTKRSARMREYVSEVRATWAKPGVASPGSERIRLQMCTIKGVDEDDYQTGLAEWPLPNVWIGVSAEDQRRADERIPDLIETPAAVRFVSAEPLLGPIEFRDIWDGIDVLRRRSGATLDWVIVGGESGRNARPMKREWADSIVSQCKDACTPVFVKQLGAAFSDETDGIAGASLRVSSEATGLISRRLNDRKGGDMAEWPEALRVREMPHA
jgi:protein gp37